MAIVLLQLEETAQDVRALVADLRDAIASLRTTIQKTRFIGESVKSAPVPESADAFLESPMRSSPSSMQSSWQ
jgi:hypothetical protein